MILASQDHPGTNLVGDYGVVEQAMETITEPVLEFLEEEHDIDATEFKEGYCLEQQCLTRALSRYHDRYLNPQDSVDSVNAWKGFKARSRRAKEKIDREL